MQRIRFEHIANYMLLGAVNALKSDLLAGKTFDEPAYTAAIATRFPALMTGVCEHVKFGGCFIHKSPIVTIDNMGNPSETERCEAGDLLVLCKDLVDGQTRINAALFQLKKTKHLYDHEKPDNDIQLKLYTEWPSFSIGRNYKNPYYNIEPKAVTPGAQYMFINEDNFYCDWYEYYPYSLQPIVFTHSIPAPIMRSDPELSFGSFLWDFMNWQDGRPISETEQTAKDDWSVFIWKLIDWSKSTTFKHKNVRIPKHIKANGDFFQFMTLPTSESHADIMFADWLSQSEKSSNQGLYDMEEFKDDISDENGGRSFAILFIDKTGEDARMAD